MVFRLTRVVTVLAVLFGGASIAAGAEQGPVTQPTVTGPAAATTGGAADPKADLKALLNSPEARSVAAFRCSSLDKPCAIDATRASALEARFDNTFLTGTGAVSPLVSELEALLGASVGAEAVWPAGIEYAIVHLVKFSDDGKPPQSHRDRWFLFRRHKGRVTASPATRILGAKRVAVVFVHLNVLLNPGQLPQSLYADVEYRAIAKRKLPINIQRLLGLLRFAAGAAQSAGAAQRAAILGYGVYVDIPVPSDLTVFGARLGGEPSGFGLPITYDNEGLYFWDVSVAVPVNKITLLQFDETGNTFTPKVINKQSVYGVINLYPWRVDIKEGNLRWFLPRALVGIGLTGKPGENILIAGAFGIPELQVFVGSAFANQRVLIPGTDPANGANYRERYASRLTYGINVPVFSVLKKAAK